VVHVAAPRKAGARFKCLQDTREFDNLIRNLANNKGKVKGNGADARSQVASNASLLSHLAFSVVDFRWNIVGKND
jgi:hypothetical protein